MLRCGARDGRVCTNPRAGEVYAIEQMIGRKLDWRYVEEARKGDDGCYISNLSKFKKD